MYQLQIQLYYEEIFDMLLHSFLELFGFKKTYCAENLVQGKVYFLTESKDAQEFILLQKGEPWDHILLVVCFDEDRYAS